MILITSQLQDLQQGGHHRLRSCRPRRGRPAQQDGPQYVYIIYVDLCSVYIYIFEYMFTLQYVYIRYVDTLRIPFGDHPLKLERYRED